MRTYAMVVAVLILAAGCVGTPAWHEPVGVPADILSRGPVVQNVTPTSAVIMGRPIDALLDEQITVTVTRVPDGRVAATERGRYDPEKDTFEIRVPGLPVDSPLAYRVAAGDREVGPFRFRTASNRIEDRVRFAMYGDTRTRTDKHASVANAILAHAPDFVLCCGDLVGDGRRDEQWDREFFGPGRGLFANAAVFPCLGNHEHRGRRYFDLLCLPGNESYYEMRWGPVRVVTVDQYQDYGEGSEQHAWLDKTLAEGFGGWTIVQFHEPPFGIEKSRGINTTVIQNVLPLLYKHRVDLVINGHDHYYLRTLPLSDRPGGHAIQYIISGGGGAPTYAVDGDAPYVASSAAGLHYIICDATVDDLFLRVLTPGGTQIDAFSLSRHAQLDAADWPTLVAPGLASRAVADALSTVTLGSTPQDLGIKLANPAALPYTASFAWQTEGTAWKLSPVAPITVQPDEVADVPVQVTPPAPDRFYPAPTAKVTLALPGRAEPIRLTQKMTALNRPRAIAESAETPPKVDGVLDEACWRSAQALPMWTLAGTGRGRNASIARAVAGPEALYVAVECAEDDMSTVRAVVTEHDDDVWTDDCVEVFVDPAGEGRMCYQFIVSVNAVRSEILIALDENHRTLRTPSWDGVWTAVTRRGGDGWTAEVRIPWATLGLEQAPAAGESLGFNVTRSEQNPDPTKPGERLYEVQQWAVTFAGNAAAHRYGTLTVK